MKLAIISYKVCWNVSRNGKTSYVTTGGFPYQLRAVANLFDATKAILVQTERPLVAGVNELSAQELTITPVPEPQGMGIGRKLGLLLWLPQNICIIWREVSASDAVHIPLPGDISLIGIFVTLAQRKPLFVRHCGTWGEPVTRADRFILWLLERIAGGKRVVMATGGGVSPPSSVNQNIMWIHSTSLLEAELDAIPQKLMWRSGQTLHLVSVSRLSVGKNTIDTIRALPGIQAIYPDTFLHIVGGGPERQRLEHTATEIGVAETVIFHGNVDHDEVLRILQQCDVFVFPTKTKEGFPKAVLEALACGLPVVATAVSVLPYLIGTKNGISLPDPTPEAVAEAVLNLIADEEKFAAMSAHARETSRQYTLERWQEIIKERLEASWGPLQAE